MSTNHHIFVAVHSRFSPRYIRTAVGEVEGFNAKLAVIITESVGTMACTYLFAGVALVSLPAVLVTGGFISKSTFPSWMISVGLITLVAWIAQTFFQLVLLPAIMVGQRVQGAASDARAEQQFANTVTLLDRLDTTTPGGLSDVVAEIRALHSGQ